MADDSAPPPITAEVVELQPAPPDGHQFPCRKCGAKLTFDPTAAALTCPYCGYAEPISADHAGAAEESLDAWLAQQGEQPGEKVDEPRANQVRCQGCGAVVLMEKNIEADRCPFCGTTLHNQPEPAGAVIVPGSVLPFLVSNRQAVEAFNQWVASRWFAPNSLKTFANLGQLAGVYMPYWTYDSMTVTWYQGMRGDDYTTTETYTTTNAQGQTETHTRTVTHTNWTSVSGRVDHFFDDVLICASQSLPAKLVDILEPWDLDHLEKFDAAYLAGFKTERYTIDLVGGFKLAKDKMDVVIRQLCCRDIGGDHQTLSSVTTQHAAVTYKHILLPMWLAAYRYHDQAYRILINARTGEVTGSRPYSWIKITLTVLASIAVAAGIAWYIYASQ